MAACWYGGARGLARPLLAAARDRDVGPHAYAHLGAIDIGLRAMSAALEQAADEIDVDPLDARTPPRAGRYGSGRWWKASRRTS